MSDRRRRWVDSDGVRLAVDEEGPIGGPTIVLVHGYPDNSTIWDGVAERLAARFRVVRYDVRGHGDSEEPRNRDGYRIERLAEDLAKVIRETSPDRPVHLVAHDWGSIQSWPAVSDPRYAALFASFTSISGPSFDHVGEWARTAMRQPKRVPKVLKQLLHSWYMAGFQLPVVPELIWRIRPLRDKFHASYRDAHNGIQLYRANLTRTARPRPRKTSVPVLQVALTQDPYCTLGLLDSADPWCERLWRRELAAGHWVVRDNPGTVARFVTEFVDHIEGRPASRELARAQVGSATRRPLEGQLVLVTGASSGIGRSTALAFANQGADVLCVDIDFDAAEGTAEEVAAHGAAGLAYQLDVADGAATRKLADQVVAEHGVPDVVMANAGIAVSGPFLDTSEEDWRRVLGVNLWGVVNTLRAFLPPLVERGEGGHLVVTASMAGFFATPNLPAYSTTKAGVLMLAECLSGELKDTGIGVSAICPGVIHTNITNTTRFAGSTAEQERLRRERATNAYRRRGYGPDKVAAAVVRAVRDNKVVVPVTPEARVAAVATRIAPSITRAFGRWVDAQATKVTQKGE